MLDSSKVKEYIKKNIRNIPVPIRELHKKFNVCKSKLDRDFKKQEDISVREYVLRLKIPLMAEYKKDNPKLKLIELMADFNYNYGERCLRNHFKQYRCENYDYDDLDSFYMLSRNRGIFSEILLRFILLYELAEFELDSGRIIVTQNVKNTIFQLAKFFIPIEFKHVYFIHFDIDTMELSFEMFTMRLVGVDREDNEIAYVPNHTLPYFELIYNLDVKLGDSANFKLTDTIKGFNMHVDVWRQISSSFSNYDYWELKPKSDESFVQIDRESNFIQGTNHIIDDMKIRLLEDFKRRFERKFDFILSDFQSYLEAIRKGESEKMISFFPNLKKIKKIQVDLLLQTISYPYLNEIYIDDYCYYIKDDSLLSRLMKLDLNTFKSVLIRFKKAIDLVTQEEDYSNEDLILRSLLSEK